jgi:hypothetical protein
MALARIIRTRINNTAIEITDILNLLSLIWGF